MSKLKKIVSKSSKPNLLSNLLGRFSQKTPIVEPKIQPMVPEDPGVRRGPIDPDFYRPIGGSNVNYNPVDTSYKRNTPYVPPEGFEFPTARSTPKLQSMKKGGDVKKYVSGGKINLNACGISTHNKSKNSSNW